MDALKTVSIASLKPFAGFGFGAPKAGDLAAVKGDEIVAFCSGRGKSKATRQAQGMVYMVAGNAGVEAVILVD